VNAYGVLILSALVAEYGLKVAADVLNLRASRADLPPEFADVYGAKRYRATQSYTRMRIRFGLVRATLDLVVLLAFWFGGGFDWLDRLVRDLELPAIGAGLVYIGALVLARVALSLPFAAYSTFVIEERFGFNQTTPATFVADRVKGLALVVAIGGPLLAAILWFFEATGSLAWLWCWGVTVAVMLVGQFVAPTWIFPLFNRFERLDEGELRDAILAYANKVSFPLEGLFVIDGSRRSTKANAFFTGFGSHKRVALFDSLVDRHQTDELVAVVAHEIGHYKKHHIQQGLALAIAQYGVLFFLLSLLLERRWVFDAFSVDQPSIYVGLVLFALLYSPVDLVLSLFVQALSRRNEFEADAYACETSGLANELATALKRLSADSLANLTPHPLYVKLHYTHPPLADRIRALRALSS